MATINSFTVQGVTVNNAVIAAYTKRLNSATTTLSIFANAAAIEASKGNLNWATKLFSTLTLKSGELSKQGKDVLAYIQRHYPLLTWDKDNKSIGRKKQGADSIFNTAFLAPTSAQHADVIEHNGKHYLPLGDFELTFEQFLNLPKAKKEEPDTEPSMQVKAFAKQANKALEFANGMRLVGSSDEFITAIVAAEAILKQLHAAHAATISAQAAGQQRTANIQAAGPVAEVSPENMPLDMTMAEQLHKSGQAGKSVRAGNKVEVAA